MRALSYCLLAGLMITAAMLSPLRASYTPQTQKISASGAELIVFEAENCIYCFIFRRDVAPGYLQSPRARDVPLRYVDVKSTDISALRLKAPLTMLPTVVLMQNGQEQDRITGYMGPEPFFHMVSRLMK